MRLLTAFIFILLCTSSCQQRYRHVKRVKADKNHSVQKEETKPDKQAQTEEIVLNDTLAELSVQAPETATEEAKTKAETPDTKARTFVEKLKETQKLFPSGIFKDLGPDRSESLPDDEPLTTSEKILIVCIFLVWFLAMMFLMIMPILFALLIYLLLGFFSGGATLSAGALAVLGILAAVMIVLVFVFSYKIGRNKINEKLGRKLDFGDLFVYFLLALVVLSIGGAIASLFPPASIAFQLASAISPLLILFALVYIFFWDF